jgi:hypothetical protein
VAATQENELPAVYVLYPDEGHGPALPENREPLCAILEVFLESCLGGRSQPVGDAYDDLWRITGCACRSYCSRTNRRKTACECLEYYSNDARFCRT